MKKIDIYKRAEEIGNYVVEHNVTIRSAAKEFMISKSTVYKDITERLNETNPILSKNVRKVLDLNKEERHIKGGESTRQKYLKMQIKKQ